MDVVFCWPAMEGDRAIKFVQFVVDAQVDPFFLMLAVEIFSDYKEDGQENCTVRGELVEP
jgi:hypothetical protein